MTDAEGTGSAGAGGPAESAGSAAREAGGGSPVVRVRLDLAYDGAAFRGWARQPGQRTVQGVLEAALGTVLRLADPPVLTVAGRTDAGVHAAAQVAHMDLAEAALGPGGPDRLTCRLGRLLPADLVVYRVRTAAPGFDARFSALSRSYAYRVADHLAARDPLRRGDTLWVPRRLDDTALAESSGLLLGRHDFAAFCRRRQGATTVRTLTALAWTRDATGVLTARVEADAFCHSMVRSLVGALLAVGDGRRALPWPGELLARRARAQEVSVAPAHGLTLTRVDYPPDGDLADRARETRAVRESVPLPGSPRGDGPGAGAGA